MDIWQRQASNLCVSKSSDIRNVYEAFWFGEKFDVNGGEGGKRSVEIVM